jgi:sugar/nucleoside kinase (ribokinase family)
VGDVTDVTGAGDTFLAAFAYEYLIQEYVQAAIKFAIRASGITVQHVGVYAPRLDQLL